MAPAASPLVVGLGGVPHGPSGTERVLRAALAAAAARGARTALLTRADLDLPLYPARDRARTPAARRLVDTIAAADGLIVASPAYHGVLSGAVKNALDYVEDLREDARPYLDGRAVGCVACAGGWQASASTLSSLRAVTHALRGWPTPLGVAVRASAATFGPDGEIHDPSLLDQLAILAEQVVSFAARTAPRQALREAA